jgi:hypothetical protein
MFKISLYLFHAFTALFMPIQHAVFIYFFLKLLYHIRAHAIGQGGDQ